MLDSFAEYAVAEPSLHLLIHKEFSMELKQYNIEPTDENILAALRQDVTGRNAFLSPISRNYRSLVCIHTGPEWRLGQRKALFH